MKTIEHKDLVLTNGMGSFPTVMLLTSVEADLYDEFFWKKAALMTDKWRCSSQNRAADIGLSTEVNIMIRCIYDWSNEVTVLSCA